MKNKRLIDKRQGQRIVKSLEDLAGIAARRVRGSGSRWYAPGDVLSEIFLFENKDTERPQKQRTIYRSVFDKIKREAFQENKIPVYVIGFGDGKDFMLMEDTDWYHIVGRMVEAEKKVKELTEALKYAHREAIKSPTYDRKYIERIIYQNDV